MIAMVILTVGMLGILLTNTTSRHMTAVMNERILALQDAHRVIELLRSTSATGTFPANVTAVYPDGAPVVGFNSLADEAVAVAYADPAADPLHVTVTVTWAQLGVRPATAQLQTLITQRE